LFWTGKLSLFSFLFEMTSLRARFFWFWKFLRSQYTGTGKASSGRMVVTPVLSPTAASSPSDIPSIPEASTTAEVPRTPEQKNLQSTNRAALQEMLGGVSPGGASSAEGGLNLQSCLQGVDALSASLPGFQRYTARQSNLRLRSLGELPTLASVVRKLRRMPRQSLVISDLVEAVKHDASLTTLILRMANSAETARYEPVQDLAQAIHLLGAQRVHFYLRGTRTIQEFNSLDGSFRWRQLWMHSLACALMAEECGVLFGLQTDDSAYLGGLLHDVGKLLFGMIYEKEYAEVLLAAHDWDIPLAEAEQWAFGTTHAELGARFAGSQDLPFALAEVIRYHQKPEGAQLDPTATSLVAIANALCKHHGLGFSGSCLADLSPHPSGMPGWSQLCALSQRPPSEEVFLQQLRPVIRRIEQQIYHLSSS
jgi:HD-like signal output (HDOD) protein